MSLFSDCGVRVMNVLILKNQKRKNLKRHMLMVKNVTIFQKVVMMMVCH